MLHALCELAMTRQPAVKVGIFLSVTLDALTHAPNLLLQALCLLDLTMTFLTGNLVVNMTLMIKQHVFGHVIDFYPWRRCIAVKKFVLLFYPWMFGNNIFMAVQAFFHSRQSGMIGIGHIGMAILALDLFNPAVNIMAERYRLLRPNTGLRR